MRALAAGAAVLLGRSAASAAAGPAASRLRLTHLGTATVLVEIGPFRLLTDPAFDPAGTRYTFAPGARSVKLTETATRFDQQGALDAVLLTHDMHADNLDRRGRELLRRDDVARVITTVQGARRLGRKLRAEKDGRPKLRGGLGIAAKLDGLAPWEHRELDKDGKRLRIVATPCQHGPTGAPKVRQAIGFAIFGDDLPCVFVSGDTIWFDELEGLGERLRELGVPPVDVAIIHAGGVRFPKVAFFGKKRFTFDGAEALKLAKEVDPRFVLPVHYGDWEHFRESKDALAAGFASDPGIQQRVVWPKPGEPWAVPEI
jgi:L-ascorbate metabolism protein UlaG (beta-lactamase superfamily)